MLSSMPIITQHPEGTTVLQGEEIELEIEANIEKGTIQYQWYIIKPDSEVPVSKIDDANSNIYSPSTQDTGVAYYYCTVTNIDNKEMLSISLAARIRVV